MEYARRLILIRDGLIQTEERNERAIKDNLFVIAFKNLFRHKFKTVITMIAVAVGVSLYIFMDAWLLGMKIDSMRNIVNFETGAINVYRKDF